MSAKSNYNGRALEYAYILNLKNEITKYRSVNVKENSSLEAAKRAFETLTDIEKSRYNKAATAGILKLFELEPLIIESDSDRLTLALQNDQNGENGDVRDILIERDFIQWQIGISIKHNHFAVKHSRISASIDFGEKWYDIPCSDAYWNAVKPIFARLEAEKAAGKKWRDLKDKTSGIYLPLLIAFRDEINRQNAANSGKIPPALVQYLLGIYDFHKMISIDAQKTTQIISYNLNKTLGKNAKKCIARKIPLTQLPTRIIACDLKPKSATTLELFLDGGWQFSFRIHSAASLVENSLKFDIKTIGKPNSVLNISVFWA